MTNLPEQMHAPASTAVAARRPAAANDELDSSDVRLPRMKLAQLSTKQVEAGVLTYGDVFIGYGQDDQEPTILAKGPKAGAIGDEVLFYVLGVTKGYSWTDAQNRLQISPDGTYPDLAQVKGQDPKNVRRTYDYLLVVPEFPELPVKFIMHGAWGGQAAKTLNTRLVLAKQKGRAPAETPFKLQVQKTENDKGSFVRALVAPAEVPAKDRAAHAAMVSDFMDLAASASVVDDDAAAPSTPVDAPSLA